MIKDKMMSSELLNLATLLFVVYLIHKVSILEKHLKNHQGKTLPNLSIEDKELIKSNKNKAIKHLMTKYSISFEDAKVIVNSPTSEGK